MKKNRIRQRMELTLDENFKKKLINVAASHMMSVSEYVELVLTNHFQEREEGK